MGKSKERTLLNFRMNLAKQMIGQFQITRKRKRISNIDPNEVRHWPIENEKRGRCKNCFGNKIRKDVKTKCSGCDIFLCIDCFKAYHSQ